MSPSCSWDYAKPPATIHISLTAKAVLLRTIAEMHRYFCKCDQTSVYLSPALVKVKNVRSLRYQKATLEGGNTIRAETASGLTC
jgi:hypothetical protein